MVGIANVARRQSYDWTKNEFRRATISRKAALSDFFLDMIIERNDLRALTGINRCPVRTQA